MHLAYREVVRNKGSAGVDGMGVNKLKQHIQKDREAIVLSIINGGYLPQPILGVSIPKGNGKTRLLGIPTVTERWLQQSVAQTITPLFEYEFKEHSYGFRPNKSAHQCIQHSQQYIHEGYQHIVDIDLKSFFDEVDHCLLLQLLYGKVKCPVTLQLIRKWLRSPIMINGKLSKRRKGVPQGSPLTPRTHPQTLNFLGEYRLKEVNFNYFTKSITFMINGKVTEYGIGKTYQPGLCFIEEGKTSIWGDRAFDEEVWCVSNPGVSLCSASQRAERKKGDTGSICGIYCQNTSQPDHQDKKVRKLQRDVYQRSSQSSAGRFFSKERSWPKKRGKLKYHSPTIGCGSKSSLRFTIFSFQPITRSSKVAILMMN